MTDSHQAKSPIRVSYLCLDAARQGQASHAHVHEIANGLRRRGWDVTLFEPAYAVACKSPSIRQRAVGFLMAQLRLCRQLRNTDVVYVRSHFAAFPTTLSARLFRIPIIHEINGPYEDIFTAWPWTRRIAPLFRWLVRTQYCVADALITVTSLLESWVRDQGIDTPIHVIPNGANTDLFTPQSEATDDVGSPYVVFFGALTAWQGIDLLIEAAESAHWPPEVKLVIIGDGAKRRRVEEASRISRRVIYLGQLPYRAVPGIVARSIAGLVPKSHPQGWSATGLSPLKLFETLACGVPAIVTDWPGQSDLVREHRCGLVVRPDDPIDLARAVAHLYEDAEKRQAMGRRGREIIVQEHSWDLRAGDTARVLIQTLRREAE